MTSNKVKFILSMMTTLVVVGFSSVVFAEVALTAEQIAQAAIHKNHVDVAAMSNGAWIALAAGLAIGLAALGGALAQGRTAAAALEGIARNPASADRIFTPMILGLALIESLVIYALIIAFLLVGKIG